MSELNNYLEKPAGWKSGIYDLESYAQYAAIKALRSSDLKKIRRSPAHYKEAVLNPAKPGAALEKAFAKGKAFDTLVLHGSVAFDNLVTIEPDLRRNTKAYKQWKEKNADAECVLSLEEKLNVEKMMIAALQKKRFAEIFDQQGFSHRVIIWQDRLTGLWCKAEIDWIKPDGSVVDLKSTADAGFLFFSKNAARLGYLNQAAFYLDGLTQVTGIKHDQFYFAAVEVDPPFESHVFKVFESQIDRAKYQNEQNMFILKECMESDYWPGYPDHIIDMDSGHYIYEPIEEEGTVYGF